MSTPASGCSIRTSRSRFYEALGYERRGKLQFETAYNIYMGLPGDADTLELTVNIGREEPYDLGDGYNHIALTVDDLDALLAELSKIGVEPEKPPFAPGRPPRGRADLLRPGPGRLPHRADRRRRVQDPAGPVAEDLHAARRRRRPYPSTEKGAARRPLAHARLRAHGLPGRAEPAAARVHSRVTACSSPTRRPRSPRATGPAARACARSTAEWKRTGASVRPTICSPCRRDRRPPPPRGRARRRRRGLRHGRRRSAPAAGDDAPAGRARRDRRSRREPRARRVARPPPRRRTRRRALAPAAGRPARRAALPRHHGPELRAQGAAQRLGLRGDPVQDEHRLAGAAAGADGGAAQAGRAGGATPIVCTDQEGGAIRNVTGRRPRAAQAAQVPGPRRQGGGGRRCARPGSTSRSRRSPTSPRSTARRWPAARSRATRRAPRPPTKAAIGGWLAGGVAPTVKHFPGLGGATVNTDHGSATIRGGAPTRADLAPFKAAIAAKVPIMMSSHARLPALDARPHRVAVAGRSSKACCATSSASTAS